MAEGTTAARGARRPPRSIRAATRNAALTGSAARGVARRLRKRGYSVVGTESYLVDDSEGPLHPGEVDRARAWAAGLVAERLAAGADRRAGSRAWIVVPESPDLICSTAVDHLDALAHPGEAEAVVWERRLEAARRRRGR